MAKYKVLEDIPGQDMKKGDVVELTPFRKRLYLKKGWIEESSVKEEKSDNSTKEEKTAKKRTTKGKK